MKNRAQTRALAVIAITLAAALSACGSTGSTGLVRVQLEEPERGGHQTRPATTPTWCSLSACARKASTCPTRA